MESLVSPPFRRTMPDKSMRKLQNVTRFRTVPGALAAFGLMLAWGALAQSPAPAPAATAPTSGIASADGEDKTTANFVNADIQARIKALEQQTARNFILDPRVTD